jgi:hypothetical protein
LQLSFRICYTEGPRKQKASKVKGRLQLAVYVDDIRPKFLGEYVYSIKIKIETLSVVSKMVDLEVNAEKTKYMFMSRKQNAVGCHNIGIK